MIELAEIEAARERIRGAALRTPLVRLYLDDAEPEIWCKLETLQPIGSFKIRPVGNAVLARPAASLAAGLYTCSSGNSAVAVAWLAQRLEVPATAVVTEAAPAAKIGRLRGVHLGERHGGHRVHHRVSQKGYMS